MTDSDYYQKWHDKQYKDSIKEMLKNTDARILKHVIKRYEQDNIFGEEWYILCKQRYKKYTTKLGKILYES